MLAGTLDRVSDLTFQYGYVSGKIDGIRCVVRGAEALSRRLKAIPNEYVRETLSRPELEGIDGELTVGDHFSAVSSGIMSHSGRPDFTFRVFDSFRNPKLPYYQRLELLTDQIANLPRTLKDLVLLHPQYKFDSVASAERHIERLSDEFPEGGMFRHLSGEYKFGRSTLKQGWLLKFKHWQELDAEIIGFVEAKSNQNEAEIDERGYTKRSRKAEGMVPKGTLGALQLRAPGFDDFEAVSGLDDAQKQDIWDNPSKYRNLLVRVRYLSVGMVSRPRNPTIRGFKAREDA